MENKSLLLILVLFFIGVTFAFLAGFGIFYFSNGKSAGQRGLFGNREEPTQVVVSPAPVSMTPSPTPYVSQQEATESAAFEVDMEICSDWTAYTNTKYDYKFEYDPGWMINTNMPGSESNDRIVLQGDISEKGWPSIEISLQTFQTAPATIQELKTTLEEMWGESVTVSLTEFGKNDISAVKIATQESPQAYAMESYYFIHGGEYFVLTLNDATNESAQGIYNCFLANFETL